jgi:hypothetical protein
VLFVLILAILTGVASFFNYYWQANFELSPAMQIVSIAGQAALLAATLAAAVLYRGRRLRNGYEGYKVFTLPFAVIVLSILGNIAVLAVLILNALGVLQIA